MTRTITTLPPNRVMYGALDNKAKTYETYLRLGESTIPTEILLPYLSKTDQSNLAISSKTIAHSVNHAYTPRAKALEYYQLFSMAANGLGHNTKCRLFCMIIMWIVYLMILAGIPVMFTHMNHTLHGSIYAQYNTTETIVGPSLYPLTKEMFIAPTIWISTAFTYFVLLTRSLYSKNGLDESYTWARPLRFYFRLHAWAGIAMIGYGGLSGMIFLLMLTFGSWSLDMWILWIYIVIAPMLVLASFFVLRILYMFLRKAHTFVGMIEGNLAGSLIITSKSCISGGYIWFAVVLFIIIRMNSFTTNKWLTITYLLSLCTSMFLSAFNSSATTFEWWAIGNCGIFLFDFGFMVIKITKHHWQQIVTVPKLQEDFIRAGIKTRLLPLKVVVE